MDRATFSNVTIKTISEDLRELEGWASTNSVDRVGDILEPSGAAFKLPMPLLLDHRHDQVVGAVYKAQVTKTGIKFWARVTKIDEPGPAKDLCDHAWQLLKHRLRPSVSVGFAPIEYEPLPGGGLRFLKWDWYELSAVGIPANADCMVTGTKAAASSSGRVVRIGTAKRSPVVKLNPVSRARIAGTLKINVRPKWQAGDPLRIVRTAPRVVKLDPVHKAKQGPHRVVRLTATDIERGKRRASTVVVKLGRR